MSEKTKHLRLLLRQNKHIKKERGKFEKYYNDILSINHELVEKEYDFQSLQIQKDQLEKQLEEAIVSIVDLENENEELRCERDAKITEVKKFEKVLVFTKETTEIETNKNKELEQEKEKLQKTIDELLCQINSMNEKHKQELEEQFKELENKRKQEIIQHIEPRQVEKENKEIKVIYGKKLVEKDKKKQNSTNERIIEMKMKCKDKLEELVNSFFILEKEIDESQDQLSEEKFKERVKQEVEKKEKDMKKEIEKKEKSIEKEKENFMKQHEKEMKSEQKKNEELEREKIELEKENEQMKNMINQMKNEYEKLKQMMETPKQPVKDNQLTSQPETISITIPIQFYITGEQLLFEYQGKQLKLRVDGNTEDGHLIAIGENGEQMKEGESGNILYYVQVRMETHNGMYQRDPENPTNIIQMLSFSKQYEGMPTSFDHTLPDGTTQPLAVEIKEGHRVEIEGKGLKKRDGTFGNLLVWIHLSE